MAKPLNFGRDINSYNAFAPQLADYKYRATLATSTESNITLPTSYPFWIVSFVFQPGTTVWVDMTGATATVPASGTLTATTAELNPGQRTLPAGAKISMISANTSADVFIQGWPQSE